MDSEYVPYNDKSEFEVSRLILTSEFKKANPELEFGSAKYWIGVGGYTQKAKLNIPKGTPVVYSKVKKIMLNNSTSLNGAIATDAK